MFDLASMLQRFHDGGFAQQPTVHPQSGYGQQQPVGSLSAINFNAPESVWMPQLEALYPRQLLAGDQGVFGNYATRGDQSLQAYLAGGGQPIRAPMAPGSSVAPYSTYAPGTAPKAATGVSPQMGTPTTPNTGIASTPTAPRPGTPMPGGWNTSAIEPVNTGSSTNNASLPSTPSATGGSTSTSASPINLQPSLTGGEGGATQAPSGTNSVDWNSLFHPGGYDGTVMGYDAIPDPTIPAAGYTGTETGTAPTIPGGTSASGGGALPGGGNFPTGAETLGQSMYPWLTPYAGNFTAPMSTQQNQGLQGIGNFVEGGQNLGGAQQYLNSLLSGQFLSPSTNPYLAQVANAASGIHDYQDQLERQRIASSMAAGGNALSGARGAAEEQYQNESNNQFQNMLNNMYNQNYQNERGLMQQGVPLEMGMANQVLGGYNNLMSAGSVPQQLSQNDLTAQYGDYLRQIQGLQSAYNQPYQNAMGALSHGYTSGTNAPQYGTSQATGWAALLASLLGGGSGGGLLGSSGSDGSSGSGLLGLLSSLFGGGGGNGSGSTYDPNFPTGGVSTGQDQGPQLPGGYDPNQTPYDEYGNPTNVTDYGYYDSNGNFIPFNPMGSGG